MGAYYNEFDPKAAAWLRELIKQGHIAPGEVDERDLWDVSPSDLAGFDQVHLCAGIGVWSYALRKSGWEDTRPVWTASFPCQPFSAAGKGAGFADERHLWPAGFHIISECRPAVVFGEQVSSKDGLMWFDLVSSDLEAAGYAVGALDTCSAGVGAPHIRQRLYWVADATVDRDRAFNGEPGSSLRRQEPVGGHGVSDRLADDDDEGLEGRRQPGRESAAERSAGAGGVAGGVALADGGHPGAERQQRGGEQRQQQADGGVGGVAQPHDAERRSIAAGGHERDGQDAGWPQGSGDAQGRGRDGDPGPTNGLWRDADWLFCRDGKWRPVEPGTFPLAHGSPARVGRLRGYGNAINAEAAQAFIESYLDARTINAGA